MRDLYENVHMMTNCVWQGVQGQLQFEEPRTLPLLQDIRPTHTTGIFDQNSSDAQDIRMLCACLMDSILTEGKDEVMI